jgi:hypothetical protein
MCRLAAQAVGEGEQATQQLGDWDEGCVAGVLATFSPAAQFGD